MPQFDFTTYSSQIFWFSLCFVVLYLAVSLVILPRIRDIIAIRKNVVDSDKLAAGKIERKISDLKNKTEKLHKEASSNYESKMNEISSKALRDRDEALTKLKSDLEERVKKSRLELKSFVETSEVNAVSAIQSLVQNIKTKILS